MITSEVTSEVMVADHIALDLHPAAGSALETAEILDGLEVPEQFDFKKVVHILGRDHGIRANAVNGLYFRLNGNGPGTDSAVARRYLPNKNRPAAGIRFHQEADDPFAIFALNASAMSAVKTLPRVAKNLNNLVANGRLSEHARDEITTDARQVGEAVPKEVKAGMALMLPK